MWLYLIQRFFVIPVHLINRSFLNFFFLLAFWNNTFCNNIAFFHIKVMNCRTVFCCLAYSFCNNVFCTFQSIKSCFYIKSRIFIVSFNIFFCFFFNFSIVHFKHCICQRFQSLFCSYHATSLLFLFEWSPQIFQ